MTKSLALLLLFFFTAATAANAQGRIVFGATTHDFGTIAEGTQAEHTFTLRNEGNEPFTLSDVRPSCGCTTPEWPREAVAPGDSARIEVVYDSSSRPGRFKKAVYVISNAEPDLAILYIEGIVKPAVAPESDHLHPR